jgi:chromosome partitioning protein
MTSDDAGGGAFVIAVANRKGGTGKTTTAVNLAAGLARRNLATLLVDLDSQGHAGLAFGAVAAAGEANVHQIFAEGPGAITSAIRRLSGPSPWPDLVVADTRRPHPSDAPPDLLAQALSVDAIRRRYDVVVVDTPPSLDALMVTALAAAHAVLIPFVPHPLAVEGVRQFTSIFFKVRLSSNRRLRHLALLPVMANAQFLIHRRMIDALTQEFGERRLVGLIRSDIRLAEAFEIGRPIFDHAPSSRGAQDYHALIERLSSLWRPNGVAASAMAEAVEGNRARRAD